MKPVEFHPEARQDALDGQSHYDAQRIGLGADFERELKEAVERIRLHPRLYGIERGRVRRCILSRFSYSVLFADLPGRIWIAAVAHHRRRPNYWRHRRPTP